jgi:Flp pilus assembly protein TadG
VTAVSSASQPLQRPLAQSEGCKSQLRLHWRQFRLGEHGSVAVPFSFSLMAILFFVGMAIDVGFAYSAKSKLDAITDSASLAGASRARSDLLTSGTANSATTAAILKTAGTTSASYFKGQVSALNTIAPKAETSVTFKDGQVTSKVTYTASYRSHLLGLFGHSNIALVGESVSAAAVVPFMEVTLLIDTSGSMAIGADSDDQDLLRAKIGCAFACHDNAAVNGYGDAYLYAKAMGITLRYDAVNIGIQKLIDEFDDLDPSAKSIEAAIVSFDTKFVVKQAMTASRSKLRWNLPTAPATSGETEGATKFAEGINSIVTQIGKGGSGASENDPIKIVILATDGVQDPGRFWVSQPSYRKDVGAFNGSFCETLKNKNVRVGVLHTPYIPMAYDWGYMETLGQPSQTGGGGSRADDVPRVLKTCAGDLYFEADSSDKIAKGFVSILRSAGMTPRLVM